MNQPTHILTVTETTTDGITEQDYEIYCPGVTDRCRQQVECDKGCTDDDLDAMDEPIAHGVRHHWFDGSWYVPTDRCHLIAHDHLADAAHELNLRPGRYPVDFDFGDGFELELTVLIEVAA